MNLFDLGAEPFDASVCIYTFCKVCNLVADNALYALAKNWREHDYSFEGRDVLPNGDEVWIYTTLELGLPVLWVKHPDGSFDYRVLHTPGYDKLTGEHWCWNCHCQMVHHDDKWLCPKCGDHIDDNDIDLLSSPTEEASYPDDDLEPEPEWYD